MMQDFFLSLLVAKSASSSTVFGRHLASCNVWYHNSKSYNAGEGKTKNAHYSMPYLISENRKEEENETQYVLWFTQVIS